MDTKYTNRTEDSFHGRHSELKELNDAWRLATGSNPEPQIRVLISESGFGKTRTAQRFYEELAMNDPNGYWPKNLSDSVYNKQIMPTMDKIPKNREIECPWFWWGVRCLNPNTRNSNPIDCPILYSKVDPKFQCHQEALLFTLRRKNACIKLAWLFLKASLGLFPSIEIISNLINSESDIREVLSEYGKSSSETLDKKFKKAHRDTIDRFRLLCDPNKGIGLPLVLLVDDAQWIGSFTLDVLKNFWKEASQEKWRVLIIATHREAEWNENFSNQGTFANWIKFLNKDHPKKVCFSLLKKLDDQSITEILKKNFPGLSQIQLQYFVDLSSGNPLYIKEVILFLKNNKDLFSNNNFSEDLANNWERVVKARLSTAGFEIVSHHQKRFQELEVKVKEILGIASLQGSQFLRDFTIGVAEELGFPNPLESKILDQTVNPHCVAQIIDENQMEFCSSTFVDAAYTYIKSTIDSCPTKIPLAINTCMRNWIKNNKLNEMPIRQKILLHEQCFAISSSFKDNNTSIYIIANVLELFYETSFYALSEVWIKRWKELSNITPNSPAIEISTLIATAHFFYELGETDSLNHVCNIISELTKKPTDKMGLNDLLQIADFYVKYSADCYHQDNEDCGREYDERAATFAEEALKLCENLPEFYQQRVKASILKSHSTNEDTFKTFSEALEMLKVSPVSQNEDLTNSNLTIECYIGMGNERLTKYQKSLREDSEKIEYLTDAKSYFDKALSECSKHTASNYKNPTNLALEYSASMGMGQTLIWFNNSKDAAEQFSRAAEISTMLLHVTGETSLNLTSRFLALIELTNAYNNEIDSLKSKLLE